MSIRTHAFITMNLTYEELDLLISKISFGKEMILVNNEFVSLKHPTNEVKIKAKIMYSKAYDKAISDGLLPKKDLEELIIARGIFSSEDEEKVSKLQSRLDAQEILLSKTLKVKTNQDRLKKIIKGLKDDISVILYKKYSKLYMSAESKTEEEVNGFICSESTHNDDGSKFWETYNDFITEKNSDIKDDVFSAYVALIQGTDVATIRFIARSTLWRIRYTNSAKNIDTLFGKPSTDYSVDQLNLVYWSNYYDQIYQMMPSDRPSDEVIDEDDLLDKFMEEYYKEMNNETSILKERKIKNKGSLSAFDSEEVIVTQSNELYLDIEYDKPREAQKIKDRADIKKRTVRG